MSDSCTRAAVFGFDVNTTDRKLDWYVVGPDLFYRFLEHLKGLHGGNLYRWTLNEAHGTWHAFGPVAFGSYAASRHQFEGRLTYRVEAGFIMHHGCHIDVEGFKR